MIKINSYAKINIFLNINGKRSDGYHDLQTLFAQIDLHDEITIKESEQTNLSCNWKDVPTGKENLIIKVINMLNTEYGFNNKYEINLNKTIPTGSGLGGGSSNAACFLKAVNSLSKLGLGYSEMSSILGKIGSDTVYFLHDKPCLAEGRGELIVKEVELPSSYLVIVNPNIHVSTAEIFSGGNLKLTEKLELTKMPNNISYEKLLSFLHNGLEKPVFQKYPIIENIKSCLVEFGADSALMSGSGSTVFGVCKNLEMQNEVFRLIKNKFTEFSVYKSMIKGAG